MMASNNFSMNMIQSKLNELIGKPSGYINSLPAEVTRRVNALKNVQSEQAALELQMKEEILELEKRYSEKLLPFYEKRTKIIKGEYEPTEVECQAKDSSDEPKVEEIGGEKVKGIPDFWLNVLRSNPATDSMITPEDEDALKHLIDIRVEYLKEAAQGFRLSFEFSENDYFENKVISKTYYLAKSEEDQDFIMDRSEADEIQWKEGKNLGVKEIVKTQRKPGTKKTRTIKKTVEKDSFFNFFKSMSMEDDEEEEDEENDYPIEERLQADFGLGDEIKSRIIPRAVDWFTGEANEEDYDDYEDEEDYDEENGDEDGDDKDSEDDDETKGNAETADNKPANPECKQQ